MLPPNEALAARGEHRYTRTGGYFLLQKHNWGLTQRKAAVPGDEGCSERNHPKIICLLREKKKNSQEAT